VEQIRLGNIKVVIGSIVTAMLLFACSAHVGSPKEGQSELLHINIERIDSSSANITHAYLRFTDNELVLRGELKRRLASRGIIPGHLHVEIVDSVGDVIDESVVYYTRKCTSSSTSTYMYKTRVDPGRISVIRITHHNTHSHSS